MKKILVMMFIVVLGYVFLVVVGVKFSVEEIMIGEILESE